MRTGQLMLSTMGPDFFDRATTTTKLGEFAHFWSTQRIQVWRATGERATEKKYAQSFWSDLLRCFGIIPERINLFERDAQRASTGSHGWIDFFMTGVAIGEAKSLDVDLDDAVEQINDYLRGGIRQSEYPRYAIVTNFATLRIIRLDGTEPETRFPLEEIAEHYDQLRFLIGEDTITSGEQEEASTTAAQLMAELYTSILGEDIDAPVGDDVAALEDEEAEDERVETTAVLMTRLLFLLYGDDAGLWEKDLFYRWVHDETTPASLSAQLSDLFRVLNTPASRRSKNLPELLARFPYVNGGIFAEHVFIDYFTPETRDALLAACRFQWNRISVSVFGAMFQLVKSKEARRAAGEHYTSETNILKTIGPLFLEDYQAKADRLIRNKSTRPKDFDALIEEMAGNIYVDPACGGGNFLNVAYARLRDIETSLLVEKQRRGGEFTGMLDVTLGQKLTIDRFYGFEINWWPAKIAETAMFLVDHQANQRLAHAIGQAPDRLPITITAHITHGNALALDWAEVLPEPAGQTFIFGNPPFLGHATRTLQQAAELREAWGTKDISRLDYVTAWHAKALDLYRNRRGEFAFVTTNSITQGDQPARLFKAVFETDFYIKFAHRTFAWDSQAPGKAAVHCVIVGFTRDVKAPTTLWHYSSPISSPHMITPKNGINAYLVDAPNVLVEKRNKPLSPSITPATFGNMARDGGNLIVEVEEYESVASDPYASKYLRPFIGSRELLHGLKRWCLWMEGANPADISRSPVLKERLGKVTAMRANSKAASTRKMAETPHLFGQRSQPESQYLCLPKVVSENRKYFTVQQLPSTVIASDLVFTVIDPDGLQFALASSGMFLAWQKTIGGRLESRLRFANTLTWNTFPVPKIDGKQREAIVAAGRDVLAARDLHPERSLAEHYHPLAMDPALLKAHGTLDRAVDMVFGAPKKLATEEQRLEVLFKRYQELIS